MSLALPSTRSACLIGLPESVCSFRCSGCCTELCAQSELVSRAFSGSGGPAWLVRTVVNVAVGPRCDKLLLTGPHEIANIYCQGCGSELGWTYFSAPEASQAYKKGKSILEKGKIYKDNKWL